MKNHQKSRSPKHDLIREVLRIFQRDPRRVFNYKQVSKQLRVQDHGTKMLLSHLMDELTKQGTLVEEARGRYRLKDTRSFATGTIQFARSGVAFVTTEELEQDIFIHGTKAGGAMPGDTVKVAVSSYSRGKRPEGEVVEVLVRAKSEFTGVLEISGKFAYVIPMESKVDFDIYVPLDKLMGAKDGEVVLARINAWPEETNSAPEGEVIEIFGKRGENNTEICTILAEFGLPRGFPKDLEAEAKLIPTTISDEEVARRRDFRGITTFTIDPVDAKDFDDALSIRKLDNGNYEIGVHIADVTHYVKPGTRIEQEAQDRATSIYLVDRVIPMLPEVLSNLVCSLRPNEEKLCFSAVFELNEKAEIKNEWFGRTVILSERRFTYEQVQDMLETNSVMHEATPHLFECLKIFDGLAKVLREKRMSKGAISFDRAEVRFNLNEKGEPTGVYMKVQKDAHKLIEEFMLLANRKVAELLGKPPKNRKDEKPGPCVFRVHDPPNPDKIMEFNLFIRKFGHKISTGSDRELAGSLNKLLSDVKGKAEQNVVETLALRSMAKACYTIENNGHYGLAFDYYTHFTSPIRRYPDMMVHRLLDDYLKHQKPPAGESLEKLCKHSSKQEQLAAEAERASVKYKQVEFMSDKVGMDFTGIISGVTEWGMFIELEETKCEGLIRLADMKGDFYKFDEKNYRVIGSRRGKVYQLGDKVEITVKRADLLKKQLEFELAWD